MNIDGGIVAYALQVPGGLIRLHEEGITEDLLEDEWRPVWKFVLKCSEKYGKPPSVELLRQRFPDFDIPNIDSRDLPALLDAARQRHKYKILLHGLGIILRKVMRNYEDVEIGIHQLQQLISKLSEHSSANNGHPSDVFDKDHLKQIIKAMKMRKSMESLKIGFPTLDYVTGGLMPGQLLILTGRPASGKSFLAVNICSNVILQKHRVLFYSLEMTKYEIFGRLLSILARKHSRCQPISSKRFHTGQVPMARFVSSVKSLLPEYRSYFYISETPKTIQQIEADIRRYQPNLVWIDYLTLMPRRRNSEEWVAIGELSAGLKRLALKNQVAIGVCAQQNRLAASTAGASLETIALSDRIGQDADIVLNVANGGNYHYLQLLKNRNGPPLPGMIKLIFAPDEGLIEENPELDPA